MIRESITLDLSGYYPMVFSELLISIVSVLPSAFVSTNTDFNRYVPLESPLMLDIKHKELPFSVSDHEAPSTSFHIHSPLCFCKVCLIETFLTLLIPVHILVHSAVLAEMLTLFSTRRAFS